MCIQNLVPDANRLLQKPNSYGTGRLIGVHRPGERHKVRKANIHGSQHHPKINENPVPDNLMFVPLGIAARASHGANRALGMAAQPPLVPPERRKWPLRVALVPPESSRFCSGLAWCYHSARDFRAGIFLRHTGSKIAIEVP